MVEYRQRLRVMLSATQGKYELEKSSGRIGENINYIYYFTYFYPYSTHPYWEEFNKEFKEQIEGMIKEKIKPCLDGLNKSVEGLQETHKTLKETVTNTIQNISDLIKSVVVIEKTVKETIDKLKEHIIKQVEENKELILKSIKDIETKITYVESLLKFYATLEVFKIQHSQLKINGSILPILRAFRTTTLHIEQIKFLLTLTSKITLTFKVGEKRMSKEINDDSGDSYLIGYKIEEFSQKIEEALELKHISESLKCISDTISKLKPLETSKLHTLEDLKLETLENLKSYQEKIEEIDKEAQRLQETLAQINRQKEQIKTLVEKLTEQCKSESVKFSRTHELELSTQKGSGPQTYQNFKAQSKYAFTITKTIVFCNDKIKEHLDKVCEQIAELEDHIKTYREHLQAIKQQLRDLQVMKAVSKGLNVIKFLNSNLDNIIFKSNNISELIKKLVSDKITEQCILELIDKECRSRYFVYINCMKSNLDKLLCLTEKRYLSSKSGNKGYLTLARTSLYSIMCGLTELLRLGDNIIYAHYAILAIKELQDFQKEIEKLNVYRQKLEPLRETLKGYTAALETIRCRIDKLYDLEEDVAKLPDLPKLEDLSKLQDMPKNLQTLNELYTSIQQLNLSLNGFVGGDFLEALKNVAGVVGGNAENALSTIVGKLSEVTKEYSKKIIETFKQKVQIILEQCSTRLSKISVPTVKQNSICRNITTCIVHANGLIFISNFRTCNELDNLDNLLPDLRECLNKLESCIKCVTSICQKIKDCECVTAAVSKIESGCKTGDEILNSLKECIEELKKKKEDIEQKKKENSDAKNKITVTLKEAKVQIVKIYGLRGPVTFKLECLEHNLKKVTLELAPFVDKVNGVICTLEKEIQHLRQQLKTTREELDIINGFKSSVEQEIEEMKDNIDKIRKAGTNINEHYSKYTAAFTAFKEALEDLETCLDYLIRDFLKCSLCTTICNLKRQLRDTKWQCPDTNTSSSCNSCLGSGVMTDKVSLLQASLHKYVFSLLGHFTAVDTKVFISKLYRCIVRVDQIVGIVQVVDCCCCVKGFNPSNSDQAEKTVNANQPKAQMMKYRDFFKSNEETHDNQDRLDKLGDSDNSKHLCLCLAIRHKLYPCLLKTVTLLVQLELGVSGNIAKKFGTHSLYKIYNKHSSYNSYNIQYGCNSHYISVSMMLVLATWVMINLAVSLQYRYKIEHDKVKCCTKDNAKCKCVCKSDKNGGSPGSSSIKCCPCCGCEKNNRSPSTPSSTTPKPCCCVKGEGSKRCGQAGCNNEKGESSTSNCCCKCCCYCVCEKKRDCKCTCKPEDHCFCSKIDKNREDCYYRWFIYVILYICHLVDYAFSLGYWDIQQAMQCLSNLFSRLDAVCYEPDRRCVTLSDKGSVKPVSAGGSGTTGKPALSTLPSPSCPSAAQTVQPATSSPQQQSCKVKCCLVCLNVKVVCVSTHFLCVTHVLIGKCKGDKKDDKKEECNPKTIDCFCDCKEPAKCLEQLKKLAEANDNVKCELFSGLKEKLNKLKSVNGPPPKWTIVCECKPDQPKCPCKAVTLKNGKPCEKLKDFKGFDELKCGCESVEKCCCCCKCEECGTGKKRKCNNNNGNGGAQGTPSNGQVECPCTEGKEGKDCCCNQGTGEKKCCNCNKAEAKPPAKTTPCKCCCLSCCADEKNEDKKPEENKEQPQQQQQNQQTNTSEKNCPCKKKKKKEKKKGPHCKDDDNLKDKRCCCKCCPDINGGEGVTSTNGESGTNGGGNGKPTNPDKDCCCCCKCKTKCKNTTTSAPASSSSGVGGGGNTNCKCQNGMDKDKNGQTSVQQNGQHKCNCYCCFECKHDKSALKSVCKQFAHQLKSSISVLSKLASNLTIECCEDKHEKLRDTLKDYLDKCNQRFPKTCLTATRTGRGCG